jgi:hypothetical protein
LPNRRPLEAHVGFPPRTIAAPVAEPLVIDAKPSGPADAAVDDGAADVRPVLREMQRRAADRTKGFDDDAGGA